MRKKTKIDLTIVIPIILFAIISITTIYSAMTYSSSDLGNIALKQAIWYLIGGIIIFILFKLKNDYLYRNAWVFYIICNKWFIVTYFMHGNSPARKL